VLNDAESAAEDMIGSEHEAGPLRANAHVWQAHGRAFEKLVRCLVVGQQILHLATKVLVALAGRRDERLPLGQRAFQRGLEILPLPVPSVPEWGPPRRTLEYRQVLRLERRAEGRSRATIRSPAAVLGDNARALVAGRDRETGTVVFQPAYLASAATGTCSRGRTSRSMSARGHDVVAKDRPTLQSPCWTSGRSTRARSAASSAENGPLAELSDFQPAELSGFGPALTSCAIREC
jgi:hypothetical protein